MEVTARHNNLGLVTRHTFDPIRPFARQAFVLVGGHAAAAFPSPLEFDGIDAICLEDGEEVAPAVVDALEKGVPPADMPGLRLRTRDGWVSTPPLAERVPLDAAGPPARDLVERHRAGYHCLLFKPVWLVETARGCPYRCSFCYVWQLYGRSFRERSVGAVVDDLASAGPSVFVADDLFWSPPERSLKLARALRKRGVSKRWLLVQTRTDLVARQPELLEVWRPLARDFDIFFGFEAANDAGLAQVDKDAEAAATVEAVHVARSMGYGVNGNFLIDPDWTEQDFRELCMSFVIVGSRSHATPELDAYVDQKRRELGRVEFISAGSSLKYCLVAEGRADVYPRLGPTMEWDTAAGQVIAEAAGARVTRHDTGRPLAYNKENLLNPWHLVTRKPAAAKGSMA